jgi:hypothetical protein
MSRWNARGRYLGFAPRSMRTKCDVAFSAASFHYHLRLVIAHFRIRSNCFRDNARHALKTAKHAAGRSLDGCIRNADGAVVLDNEDIGHIVPNFVIPVVACPLPQNIQITSCGRAPASDAGHKTTLFLPRTIDSVIHDVFHCGDL